MAVRIRLKRFGAKNRLQWRIVVSDIKMPRDGRFIEEIGYYDPLPAQEKFRIKQDRFDYWVKNGARVSEALKSLLKRSRKIAQKNSSR
ncbi:MAG: 30S ribosomal protein S16 [Candidatus Omnitrophica bacterium]|nr:30S ribosomal protein S16 [Candidatus Omnitrophota bacterium]